MKRSGSLTDTHRGGGGGGGDAGGSGGGGGGGDGSLNNMVNHQTNQLVDVKQDINELKALIMQILKMPPSNNRSISPQIPQADKNLRSSMTNLDPLYPQLPTDGSYPLQPAYPKQPQQQSFQQAPPPQTNLYPPQIGFAQPFNNRQQPPGYLTDTEVDRSVGGGRRRRRGGKRNGGNGYESDNNSFYAEQVPMQNMQRPQQQQQKPRRPRSPSSVASAPIGNKKNRRKKNKNIGGSWEDIRADINI